MMSEEASGLARAPEEGGRRPQRGASRRGLWLGALLVVLAFGLLVEAKLWRPQKRFTIFENVQIAEAEAWWNGQLDLPERKWDTALKDGRAYSHFPPAFSLVSALLVPVFHGVPHWFIVFGLVFPLLLLAYVLFRRRTDSAVWGATLAIGLVCGTSLFPVIDKTLRGASPYFVNQSLATLGLLILLIESFGRRRMWVAGPGLMIAALSRQMTVAYLVPLAYMALVRTGGRPRTSRVLLLAATASVVVVVPCTLNALKFGHPLDSGYMHVYTDRPEDDFSRDAKTHGLFSAHYVLRNLYYANLGLPRVYRIEVAGERQTHLRPNRMGTGIWWTTPLLLWLFVAPRSIARDPLNRAWLAGAAVAFAGLMLYHSTGSEQRGFNRYSLDYLPVLLALIAPLCVSGRRKWITLAMIGWSVVYFRWMI